MSKNTMIAVGAGIAVVAGLAWWLWPKSVSAPMPGGSRIPGAGGIKNDYRVSPGPARQGGAVGNPTAARNDGVAEIPYYLRAQDDGLMY